MVRKTIRLLNSLFVDCMEGKFIYIKVVYRFGNDSFSDRLIEISKSASLPDEDRKTLELYISVCYGEPGKNRMVPFALAKRQGILTEKVERIEKEIDNEYEEKKASLRKRAWKIYDETIDRELRRNEAINKSFYKMRGLPVKWTSENIEYVREGKKKLCEEIIHICESEYKIYNVYKNKYSMYEDYEKLIEEIIKTNNGPITKRQPPDIATGWIHVPYTYLKAAKDDLIARGYANIVESIEGLAKLCLFLIEPENHIKIRSGQYIEKKVYTRSEADMKAEMVKELANLPRYTAWVKRIDESNATIKNKTRIYSVDERFEYNKNYMEFLQRIIKETHELYCTRRDLIEEEIIKRQARWRAGVENPPVQNEPPDKSDKPRPPLTRSRA